MSRASSADEDAGSLELRDHELERIPRRTVGPLHVLENDRQGSRGGGRAEIGCQLFEQCVWARVSLVADGQRT